MLKAIAVPSASSSAAQPHNLGIAPDGRTAYAASQQQGHQALAILDVASGVERGSVPLDHMQRALNVSPDGEEVFFTEAVDAPVVCAGYANLECNIAVRRQPPPLEAVVYRALRRLPRSAISRWPNLATISSILTPSRSLLTDRMCPPPKPLCDLAP